MRLILALALLCAATIQASAQYPNGFYVDGNALMTWCEPRNAAAPSNPLCIGFVVGFLTLSILVASSPAKDRIRAVPRPR